MVRTRVKYTDEAPYYNACQELWRRTNYFPSGPGKPFLVGLATPWSTGHSMIQPTNRKITSDENHKVRSPLDLRGSIGDTGGPFDSVSYGRRYDATYRYLTTNMARESDTYDKEYRYIGPFLAVNPGSLVVDSSNSLRRNLNGVGTTAIARCKPTNHVSDLANDLSEIYQSGLPRLPGVSTWENKTRRYRGIGSEFLNSEFGWAPLVSDIRDASYAAANSHRLMKSYEENSGKKVRRTYEFPIEESVSAVDLGPSDGYTVYTNSWNSSYVDGTKSQPHLIKVTKFSRRTWFSGCFTYYLPTGYLARTRLGKIAEEAGHLYGIELTPSVIWQASPWTWAVDWFSNMGDVISNLSDWATDGLVMHYGYLMEHIVSETTYALDRPSRQRLVGGGYAYASPVTVYYESKQRVRATPFGFETTWNGMSLRQLAIAAALGLTRLF